MARVRRINVSQIEGDDANNNDANEIRPFGETGFYIDPNPNPDKPTLLIFDGVRTHLKSKVIAPGIVYGSSGDGSDGDNRDTIKLVPDADLYVGGENPGDQYLIIDPTGGEPGHIHIRAGGTIDSSNADLILGGEKNNVRVSDTNDRVTISTDAGESGPTWTFDNNGALTLPGKLTVNGGLIDLDGGAGTNYWAGSVDGTGTINKAGIYRTTSSANNSLFTLGANGSGVMSLQLDGSIFVGSTLPNNNGGLNTNFGGWLVVQSGGKFGGDVNTLGRFILDSAENGSIVFGDGTTQTTAYTGTANIARNIESENDVSIRINLTDSTQRVWRFGEDGDLTLPGDLILPGDLKLPGDIQASGDLSIRVPSGIPNGVANWQGGGGWNQGYYSAIATTGGTGTGLTVNVAAGGGGYINIGTISIANPGSGYTDGDVITINNENNIPGTFTITITTPVWEFGADGGLTLPDNSVIASYKPVTVIAALGTTQTITDSASAAPIQFVESVDTASAYSTGVFTAPYTGYYQYNVSIYFSTEVTLNSGSFFQIGNLTTNAYSVTAHNGSWTGSYLHYSTVVQATANDQIAFVIRQVSGASIDVASGSRLTIHRVSIS